MQIISAWSVVFKIPNGTKPIGYSSIMSLLKASGSYNGNNQTAKIDFSSNSDIYKSPLLDDWDKFARSVSAVRFKHLMITDVCPIRHLRIEC